MTKLTKTQINRLKTFGRKTWNSLTKEEQESFYYDTGTIGFVECMADVLHIKLSPLDCDIMEELQAYITEVKK